MMWANPTWLWGMLALALPIAIHLLSRKPGTVIPLGSLRHLQDAHTQKLKSMRLNEWLLLLLRALLISLLVLFLADPHISHQKDARWLWIEKDLTLDATLQKAMDSLRTEGYEEKVYSISDTTVDLYFSSYWHLARFSSAHAASSVVLARSSFSGFKGERDALPVSVTWITVPQKAEDFVTVAWQKAGQRYQRVARIEDEQLAINTTTANQFDSVAFHTFDTVKIALAYSSSATEVSELVSAALASLTQHVPAVLEITKQRDTTALGNSDWLIWLSPLPVPAFRGKVLSLHTNSQENIIERIAVNRWLLSPGLTSEVARRQHLAVQIMQMMFPGARGNLVIEKNDPRVMPERMMWAEASYSSDEQEGVDWVSTRKWLMAACLLILMLERWLAFHKRQ